MNLHRIAAGAISAVNPLVPLQVFISIGNVIQPDGTRAPSYAAPKRVPGQVQPIQAADLQQLDGLNLNGTKRAIFLNGKIDGLVRVANKGGDLIVDNLGRVWLVDLIAEQWPDWVKCLVTLQDGS